MPRPQDRIDKYALRWAPEERDRAQEVADSLGTSLNSAVCLLITEAHAARYSGRLQVAADGGLTVQLSADALAVVRQAAFELGISQPEAIEQLVLRGNSHVAGPACLTFEPPGYASGAPGIPEAAQSAGRPRKVPRVPVDQPPHIEGQTEIEITTEGDDQP